MESTEFSSVAQINPQLCCSAPYKSLAFLHVWVGGVLFLRSVVILWYLSFRFLTNSLNFQIPVCLIIDRLKIGWLFSIHTAESKLIKAALYKALLCKYVLK